ncbi:MAG: hypothetical protein ABI747_02860 [Candidatus Moraniibacteriota bacterium]
MYFLLKVGLIIGLFPTLFTLVQASQFVAEAPLNQEKTSWKFSWTSPKYGDVVYSIVIDKMTPEGYDAHMAYDGKDFPMKFDKNMNRLVSPQITLDERERIGAWIYSPGNTYDTMRFPMKDGSTWKGTFEIVSAAQDDGKPRRQISGEYVATVRALAAYELLGRKFPALEIHLLKQALHSGSFSGREEVEETYIWVPEIGHFVSAETKGFTQSKNGQRTRISSRIHLIDFTGFASGK